MRIKHMFSIKKEKNIKKQKITIKTSTGKRLSLIVLSNENQETLSPGILWLHGGGYYLGMKEMIYMSRAIDLVKKYNAVVISPGYSLSLLHPYPAALNECYEALLYIVNNASSYKINKNQIMIGGESAGGGLAIAVAMMARDKKEVNIAYQMPLYPMIDNFDTPSSIDNHGKVWNTRKNHFGWKLYLRKKAKEMVEPYAAPARQTNYTDLPPAYTFVGDEEPFYCETMTYINNLKKAGIEANIDVYHTNIHAFDMLHPSLDISQQAIIKFEEAYIYASKHYFKDN